MDKYSVKSTYDAIKGKLLDYINTSYLGKNDELRRACASELKSVGMIYQEPYIEANNAYKTVSDGLARSSIPDDAKEILMAMAEYNLGVFANPYKHQLDALEAFYANQDLFVSTGTGSGKTECFMWPMVSKLVRELINSPETWKVRGIRAIMLYPMNALVSDQLGRLRKMIGNREGGFHNLIREFAPGCRVPQFGMYTGRTPYSGMQDKKQNEEVAEAIEKDILNQSSEVKDKLRDLGNYPSKRNLASFVEKLRNNEQFLTDAEDAELIMRQEMQQNCPDILITNYSMLEYMLMRPIEREIWSSTKRWLDSDPDNKLLFIIDEAHMYRGSAGGEVALLVRRVFHKLGIGRDRVQFILTSASVSNQDDKVYKFACDLSAQRIDRNTFKLIKGTNEEIVFTHNEINPDVLNDYDIDELQGVWSKKSEAVQKFGKLAGFPLNCCNFADEHEVETWLYDNLKKCDPMLRIMKQTRGRATSFKELAKIAFPNASEERAEKATSALLAIAPLAKNSSGNVLYPARLHMMFRGLHGLYACSNPHCSCSNHNGSLALGHVYLNRPGPRCKCGGMIYELLNDRSCGALFLKGFIDSRENDNRFVWNEPSILLDTSHREVWFYPIPKDFKRSKDDKVAWLNSISGRLDEFNDHSDDANYIQVAYCTNETKGRPNIWSFKKCPKCAKRNFAATDFATKGNDPFFNLVSEQFYVQPPVPKYKSLANEGRKVLLFSDSRQRAALLARDLTHAADIDAMRKALTVAAKDLQEWAAGEDKLPVLSLLYVFFLKVAYQNNQLFFYGKDEEDLREAREKMAELYKNKNGKLKYDIVADKHFRSIPKQYSEHLLRQLCSHYRSLTDVALCWLEPCDNDDETFDEILKEFADSDISMTIDEFKVLFAAWAMEIMTSEYAIGADIDDWIRRNIAAYYQRFGVENETEVPPRIEEMLVAHGFSKNQISVIAKQLAVFLTKGGNSSAKYLNEKIVTLKFEPDHEWYKCPRCSGVFPFTVWGKCAHCAKGSPVLMTESDFEGLKFLREPVLRAVKGDPQALMTRINTEEHTAQLSHKDQRHNTWSTTEEYVMRFQNVHVDNADNVENDRPVDILSCTTTMEVGIDIGSLTAVGLRNIPPTRDNYQQRAGRAGRRSAAISSIVTYTDNNPHDSYYFHNPEKIISGEPRTPWIDVKNQKLAYRHFNVIFITEFFDSLDLDLGSDELGICEFFKKYFDKFCNFTNKKNVYELDIDSLVPQDVDFDFESYKNVFLGQLNILKKKVEEFPEEYIDDNKDKKERSVLDTFLENGIFPTYSFPKDVVGFYVENDKGTKIEQKPDRSLDMAISEYAPGRIVVINKKTYKSGGVYSFQSKFRTGARENPARPFFDSTEYFKQLFSCDNPSCNWMGLEHHSKCPFCGNESIQTQYLLKPWGFAPSGGKSINDSRADSEISYASNPCYSITPKEDEMYVEDGFDNLRYSKRANDPLIILNKGPKSKGFLVCRDCGAAVPGNDTHDLQKLLKPYNHPHKLYKCNHDNVVNTYLGNQFRTDIVVYEITLDSQKINVDSSGLWIIRASQTLAEAMTLAGGRLLDVEFNELKSGYRLRYSQDKKKAYVDVFLFDSLSSGAGYCSMLAERTSELMKETREVLNNCAAQCESACHECLMHYWNQRVHGLLDRYAALDLLNWCEGSALAETLSYAKQDELLSPLNALSAEYVINGDGVKHYVENDGKKKEIVVYPAMWNDKIIQNGVIKVSDILLKYAMPKVDAIIREYP